MRTRPTKWTAEQKRAASSNKVVLAKDRCLREHAEYLGIKPKLSALKAIPSGHFQEVEK